MSDITRIRYDVKNDTGELFNEKKSTFNPFPSDKGLLFRSRNAYRKSYQDIKLSNVILNRFDYMRVHLLAELMYKDTNAIAIRISDRKIRMADIEDISNIIKLTIKKTREFINRMKKLHVIAERVDNVGETTMTKYLLNPLFFSTSKYLNPDLYFLFQESLDKHIPKWAITRFHEIGNIKSDILK